MWTSQSILKLNFIDSSYHSGQNSASRIKRGSLALGTDNVRRCTMSFSLQTTSTIDFRRAIVDIGLEYLDHSCVSILSCEFKGGEAIVYSWVVDHNLGSV